MRRPTALLLIVQLTIAALAPQAAAAADGSTARKWATLPTSEAKKMQLAQQLAGARLADAEGALNQRLQVAAEGWSGENLSRLRAEQEGWYRAREQKCDPMNSRDRFLEAAVIESLECKTNMTLERTRDVGARWGG